MAKNRYTNLICAVVLVVMLAVTVAFTFGESLGISSASASMPYVEKLFSTDRVHSFDIVVDDSDWQSMLDNASAKEYIACTIVIDGESTGAVAIRTKGNSSLSSVAGSDSQRYSFKVEFDHYTDGKTYYGLDKLALNNIIQDNTYLKDYLVYQMMNAFDADSPLCSFVWITVNEEDWGLYLAVEGVEEAFAQRNYGTDYGQLYKPDSMNMNGGDRSGMHFDEAEMPEEMGQMREMMQQVEKGEMDMSALEGLFEGGGMFGGGEREGGGPGGFASSDVSLIYTDDDLGSYANIFDNAKFDPTDADKDRLIASLKQLNEGENLEEVVNIEEVLRYFVVHNYVLNFDSYTGSMVHNYYLYEEDGQLSMIAWDYNLAFGAFGMGGMGQQGATSATDYVNYPIDTPINGGTLEDRPMIGQLLANESYMERYHELFGEFLATLFDSGWFEQTLDEAVALISPYVEKDPTAFCAYEEYLAGVETLREFCLLRAESVRSQLDGTIPATSEGQAEDSGSLIDASHIDISTMGQGFGGSRGGGNRGRPGEEAAPASAEEGAAAQALSIPADAPAGMGNPPSGDFPINAALGQGEAPDMATLTANSGASGEDAAQEESPPSQTTQNQGNARGGFGGGGFGPGGTNSAEAQEAAAKAERQQWIYLGIAGGILMVGLLFAWLFMKNKN